LTLDVASGSLRFKQYKSGPRNDRLEIKGEMSNLPLNEEFQVLILPRPEGRDSGGCPDLAEIDEV
jgi:hypothetical protein